MTLLDEIGGQAAVDAAVDAFYIKVLADDRVNHWFAKTDMDKQARRQKRFLGQLLEGTAQDPATYMRNGHKHLVAEGLNDADFDAIAENLQTTLQDFNVNGALLDQIMGAVGSLRDPVLDR